MYEMNPIKFPVGIKNIKDYLKKIKKSRFLWLIAIVVLISVIIGFSAGAFTGSYFYNKLRDELGRLNISLPTLIEKNNQELKDYIPQTSQEQAIISAVNQYSPAVVSIIISKDVPVMEQYYTNPFEGLGPDFNIQIPQLRQNGTEKQEVGGGSGFIVSEDGLVITNKHVVLDDAAEYTVFTTDGKKYPATVLAKDPVQDLAVIKIDTGKTPKTFPVVKLGDSDGLQIGQTVIAIGNALGEFNNTVSVGVVSGLQRTLTASGGSGFSETLDDIIQTDAAINLGNSGGPLLNLKGEVIGINTAVAQSGQSIGFAIPINKVKRDIEQVSKNKKIVYPFIGVRYVIITEEIQQKNKLSVDYGAWVKVGSSGEAAVTKGSAAEKAGIKEGDIILEVEGQKITQDNSLAKMMEKRNPGDKVIFKILRAGGEINVDVILGERS